MKPPDYPLQAALEQREAAKQEARRRLAESLREAEQEEQELEKRERRRDFLRPQGLLEIRS